MIQLIAMKVVGLTGPAGAGKNEVAKILRRRGAMVIDADKLAHTLYIYGSPLWRKIVKAFGAEILTRGGEINRKKLGAIVFSDRRKLNKLNRLVHPILKREIIKKMKSKEFVVINAAVLKEIGLISLCDEVWVVWASPEKRKKRTGRLIKFQMSKKDYAKIGTVVVENNASRQGLEKKILALLG